MSEYRRTSEQNSGIQLVLPVKLLSYIYFFLFLLLLLFFTFSAIKQRSLTTSVLSSMLQPWLPSNV